MKWDHPCSAEAVYHYAASSPCDAGLSGEGHGNHHMAPGIQQRGCRQCGLRASGREPQRDVNNFCGHYVR